MTEKTKDDTNVDVADLQRQIDALKSKNTELKNEKVSAQRKADDAVAASEAAQDEALRQAGDIKALETRLNDAHKKAIDTANKTINELNSELKTIRVDNAINGLIAGANIIPAYKDAVEALLHRRVDYTDGEATIDGKSIADFGKEFFDSKTGAIYVQAPANSGGGTSGPDGSAVVSHSFTKENFSERMTEWSMIAAKDPAQAKAIATSVGRADLASDL